MGDSLEWRNSYNEIEEETLVGIHEHDPQGPREGRGTVKTIAEESLFGEGSVCLVFRRTVIGGAVVSIRA